jgi:hypothetical protein
MGGATPAMASTDDGGRWVVGGARAAMPPELPLFARSEMEGGAAASRASDAPQAAHLTVPMALYQSQRPQTTPSSKSMPFAAEITKEKESPSHQMTLSLRPLSLKPAALTRRKTMC